MARPALADSVVSRLMAPVVVAPADHQAAFVPDDLGSNGKARRIETCLHLTGVKRPVPDVSNSAGKQRPGFSPVGSVVILDSAGGEVAWRGCKALAPGGVVADPIGRIGDHQVRRDPIQRAGNVVSVRAV